MKWQKHSEYALVSACGHYSVAKIGHNGGVSYESWRRRAHPDGPHLIACRITTSAEARRICELDAAECAQ